MTKFEKSIIINRPVEEVWKFLSNLGNFPKWDRGIYEVRQTSKGPIGVGSTLQSDRLFLGWHGIGEFVVTEYEPNRVLALRGGAGSSSGNLRYTFESVTGGTRLTGTSEVQLGGWLKLLMPLIAPIAEWDGQDDLVNVKRVMEASA
jgi:carbon monoxide dehydrogenase subunit G